MCQLGRQDREGVGVVADEAAVGLRQPVGERAVVVPPQNVAAPVAVEVVADVVGCACQKRELDPAARRSAGGDRPGHPAEDQRAAGVGQRAAGEVECEAGRASRP